MAQFLAQLADMTAVILDFHVLDHHPARLMKGGFPGCNPVRLKAFPGQVRTTRSEPSWSDSCAATSEMRSRRSLVPTRPVNKMCGGQERVMGISSGRGSYESDGEAGACASVRGPAGAEAHLPMVSFPSTAVSPPTSVGGIGRW